MTTKQYKRTIKGVISVIYSSQKTNSKQRGHKPPTYSKKYLEDWLLNDWLFNLLYANWVNCGYQTDMKPSLDRENDLLGYCFSNQLNVMTFRENYLQSASAVRNKYKTPVYQYSKDKEFICHFPSALEASKETGIGQGGISSVCRGEAPTAGGFFWVFASSPKEKAHQILT